MSHKAHDCPSCHCMRPDPGEVMTVYVNGIPVRDGETKIAGLGEVVTYLFTETTNADRRERDR